MAPDIRSLENQLKLLNSKLTWSQKLSLGLLTIAVIAGISAMMYYMNQEEYQVLYSNLSAEDSGTVIAKLKELKVVYRLEDSGRVIKVPATRIDELRIQLASDGLPLSGKIGFEIFDRTNFGMTEFVEQVNYKRAMEGELVRTILSLKEISQARVHLVLPKESLFQDQAQPAKASVVVKLNAGKRLSESSVSGIVHLVASAVEGLDPNNVTVTDSSGTLLSVLQGSPDETLNRAQLATRTQMEKDLSAKVTRILEPVVGVGKVRSDASVVMDFSHSEQFVEKFDPQGSVIRSQQKTEELNQPVSTTTAGVPGTQSNGPSPAFIPTGKSSSSSSRQTESTNYEVSRTTRKTIESPGDIKKVSVAVLVDDAVHMEKGADGSPTRKAVPRTPEELQKLKDLVTAAIGIDSMRGDMLTVENISFDVPENSLEALPAPTLVERIQDNMKPFWKYLAIFALFLLAYVLLYRPVSKRVTESIQASLSIQNDVLEAAPSGAALTLATPKTVKELEAELNGGSTSNVMLESGDPRRTETLKQQIAEFIQRDPESSAQVFRAWLTEKGK